MNKCDPKAIKDQLHRTQGQVLSLSKMVNDMRPCAEILQQIIAARASLSRLGAMILEAEAQGCLGESETAKVKDLERVVSGLFKIT
jgi:DNA-binding FrmR family transcriptional regulator